MSEPNHPHDKWDKVLILLAQLYELYHSPPLKTEVVAWLAKFLLKMEELMEAYDEWLG